MKKSFIVEDSCCSGRERLAEVMESLKHSCNNGHPKHRRVTAFERQVEELQKKIEEAKTNEMLRAKRESEKKQEDREEEFARKLSALQSQVKRFELLGEEQKQANCHLQGQVETWKTRYTCAEEQNDLLRESQKQLEDVCARNLEKLRVLEQESQTRANSLEDAVKMINAAAALDSYPSGTSKTVPDIVCESFRALMPMNVFEFFQADPGTKTLHRCIAQGDSFVRIACESRSAAHIAAAVRKPLFSLDGENNTSEVAGQGSRYLFLPVLCPTITQGEVLSVVKLGDKVNGSLISEKDKHMLQYFSEKFLAAFLHRQREFERMNSELNALQGVMRAVKNFGSMPTDVSHSSIEATVSQQLSAMLNGRKVALSHEDMQHEAAEQNEKGGVWCRKIGDWRLSLDSAVGIAEEEKVAFEDIVAPCVLPLLNAFKQQVGALQVQLEEMKETNKRITMEHRDLEVENMSLRAENKRRLTKGSELLRRQSCSSLVSSPTRHSLLYDPSKQRSKNTVKTNTNINSETVQECKEDESLQDVDERDVDFETSDEESADGESEEQRQADGLVSLREFSTVHQLAKRLLTCCTEGHQAISAELQEQVGRLLCVEHVWYCVKTASLEESKQCLLVHPRGQELCSSVFDASLGGITVPIDVGLEGAILKGRHQDVVVLNETESNSSINRKLYHALEMSIRQIAAVEVRSPEDGSVLGALLVANNVDSTVTALEPSQTQALQRIADSFLGPMLHIMQSSSKQMEQVEQACENRFQQWKELVQSICRGESLPSQQQDELLLSIASTTQGLRSLEKQVSDFLAAYSNSEQEEVAIPASSKGESIQQAFANILEEKAQLVKDHILHQVESEQASGEKIKRLEDLVHDLKKELAVTKADKSQIQVQLCNLQREKVAWETRCNQFQTQQAEMDRVKKNLEEDLDVALNERKQFEQLCVVARNACTKAESELAELQQELEDMSHRLLETKAKLEDREHSIAEETARMHEEIDTLQEKLRSKDQQAQLTQSTLETIQQDKSTVEQERDYALWEKAALSASLQTAERLAEESKAIQQQQMEKITQLKATLTETRERLSEEQHRRQELQTQLAVIKFENEHLKEQCKRMESGLQMRDKLKDEIAQHQVHFVRVEQECNDAKVRVQALEKETRQLVSQLAQADLEKQRLESLVGDLRNDKLLDQREKNERCQEISALREELAHAREALAEARSKVKKKIKTACKTKGRVLELGGQSISLRLGQGTRRKELLVK